jgi:hypothetical protein
MRLRSTLLFVIAATAAAQAQPVDPYGAPPPAAPVPPADDPVLAEHVAQALVARAQELYDGKQYADARELANEAIAKSPTGAAAQQAKQLLASVDHALGLSAPRSPAATELPVDLTPITDPTAPTTTPIPTTPEAPSAGHAALAARVHVGLYGGVVGAMLGSLFSSDGGEQAGGAVAGGLALAGVGGWLGPRLVGRLHWSEAQIRTAGAGTVWGGVIGGLFADAVDVDGTTGRSVLVGASIGSTLLGLAGAGLAKRDKLTRGDVALMDTFAGMGAAGGLTLGMLMQPAEGEAYSVNAILGTAGGLLVGAIAAPQTNTTPRRMLRVAGLSAAGGAVPFLLYAAIHDPTSTGDERAVGALSTVGLVAGAYLGFRLTRGMDAGLDVHADTAAKDDAPPAVVGRGSDGRWTLGGLALQPLSTALAPQPGVTLSLVGGAF